MAMYEIEMQQMSDEFLHCWCAAAQHLSSQVDGGIRSWLRAHPYPPFLEHLSFRLGNQLFFIKVVDVDGKIEGPGNPEGFITAARMAKGRAMILPMKRGRLDGKWAADMPGWGLIHPFTQKPVNPVDLVTEQQIEMTVFEVHDMAVQVVRDYLVKQGYELMSWQGNPEVNPSIWFVGESKGPEWVLVRSAAFPGKPPKRPSNWQALADGFKKVGKIGHFASVTLVSAEQPFASSDEPTVPLWRGHAMSVRFTGLESTSPRN
jgi:hypothetical protein